VRTVGVVDEGSRNLSADDVAAMAGVVQAIIGFVTLLSTIAVSVIVYVGTKRITRIEFDRSIREGWNSINTLAVSDASVLAIAESLMPQPGSEVRSSESARRKWFAFMLLNVLSSMHSAASRRFSPYRSDALETCRFHLSALVRNDDIYELTQVGYSRNFAEFCHEVRQQVLSVRTGGVSCHSVGEDAHPGSASHKAN
jgi:hypothetical protein